MASIDTAARDGAADVNQLKHFTRCGMGPCQGRMCGDVAAELLAQAHGVPRQSVGHWTGRPPLRPLPLARPRRYVQLFGHPHSGALRHYE